METEPSYNDKLQNPKPNITDRQTGKKNQNSNEGTMNDKTNKPFAKQLPKNFKDVQEINKGNSKIFVKSNKERQIKNNNLITTVKK